MTSPQEVAPPATLLSAPRAVSNLSFDAAILSVFRDALEALQAGRPVIATVCETDLLGHGEILDAAAAHAVVGLVRALAIEGRKEGWQINAVSVQAEPPPPRELASLGAVLSRNGANGLLAHLGSEHLGRVAC